MKGLRHAWSIEAADTSAEVFSTEEAREGTLCVLLVARGDEVLRYRSGELGSGLQKLACTVLDGLVKTGILESPGSVSSSAAATKELSEAKIAGNALVSHPSFAALPEDVRNHCRL